MTEELKELGVQVGHPLLAGDCKQSPRGLRWSIVMRQNGILVVRTRKHKVTTDSNHKFNIAPNLLDPLHGKACLHA